MHRNIKKHWKTTLFGTLLIIGSFFYLLYSEDHSETIFFGILGIGIAFWFFPDDFISAFKTFLNRNKNKRI